MTDNRARLDPVIRGIGVYLLATESRFCMTQLPEHDEHGATPTPTGEDSPVVAIIGMVVGAVTFVLVFLIWKAFLDRDDSMKLLDFIFGAGLVKAILLYSAVTLGVAFLPKAFRFIAGLLTGMFLGAFPFFGGIVLFVFVGGAISLAGGNPILGMGPPNMSQARQRMLETACSTFLVAGLYLGAACLLITACVAPLWLKRSIRRSGRMLVQPSSAIMTTKWIVVLIVFAVVPKTFAMFYFAYFFEFPGGPQYLIGVMIASVIAYRVIR